MSSTHFWLGGSIAYRALACPGSLNAKPTEPQKPSPAADRGSMLHDVVIGLQQGRWERPEDAVGHEAFGQRLTSLDARKAALPAWRAVQAWVDGMPVAYEQRVKFRSIRQAGGTADVLAHDGVMDLKFGSIPVDVRGNAQLLFYLAAAIESGRIQPRQQYRVAIVQPAIQTGYKEWYPSHQDTLDFVGRLKNAVRLAKSKEPPLAAGEHCRWCPARQQCKERLNSPFVALRAAMNLT